MGIASLRQAPSSSSIKYYSYSNIYLSDNVSFSWVNCDETFKYEFYLLFTFRREDHELKSCEMVSNNYWIYDNYGENVILFAKNDLRV